MSMDRPSEAEVPFRRALELTPRDSDAMYNLAVCYQNGVGVAARDDAKAVEWLNKAAEALRAEARESAEAAERRATEEQMKALLAEAADRAQPLDYYY